jgi:hypothetical protein
MKLEISGQIFEKKKKIQMSNFMKISPVGTELFHADRTTKLNIQVSQFCERAKQESHGKQCHASASMV